ncbi:MAG: BatA domain-containing protein [Planctomycetales bacterium]|nr:BatA domain-containing protein [Planctomycetales bacterium]
MLSFAHPALLWGLLLAALPVLIHLINMLRHKRVEWAAMEFLLASQRRNSRWIRLRELLLLLARVGLIAGIVLLVARPALHSAWLQRLGDGRVHHVILLDDSFSMTDRLDDRSVFDEAVRVVERIGQQASSAGSSQLFTLIRFSKSGHGSVPALPDLQASLVGADFPSRLADITTEIAPTQLAVGPAEALEYAAALAEQNRDEQLVVYIVSDFRRRDWDSTTEWQETCRQINTTGGRLHLVRCADRHRPNLAVTDVSCSRSTVAAGVPVRFDIEVANFSDEVARQVPVQLEVDGKQQRTVVIDEILSGQRRRQQAELQFPAGGSKAIVARIDADAVELDNVRYEALDVPESARVLIVDGSPDGLDGQFIAMALSPGGGVRTGIAPVVEAPSYLATQPVDNFAAIFIANIDSIPADAVAAIERYANAGGGVCFVLGDRTESQFVNEQLYRDGAGVFPAPLNKTADLNRDRVEKVPDIGESNHPLLRAFRGERNSFLQTVSVGRYYELAADRDALGRSGVEIAAAMRNDAPLILDRRFGAGRVVALLTTAAPRWNNWARNPSFVVLILDLESYLASNNGTRQEHQVGQPLKLAVDEREHAARLRVELADGQRQTTLTAQPAGDPHQLVATLEDADRVGFYTVHANSPSGEAETWKLAVNVNPDEGELQLVTNPQLASRLENVDYDVHDSRDIELDSHGMDRSNLSTFVLVALLLLLLAEQALAYSASGHSTAVLNVPRR